MPLEAAAGPISLAEALAATTLADCTHWRTVTGAANQAAALARIYFSALDPPDDGADAFTAAELAALRPFCILYTEDDPVELEVQGVGTSWHLWPTKGLIVLRLELNVGAGTPAEEDRAAKNDVGQIVRSADVDNPGLGELAGRGGYLASRRIRIFGPWRCAEDRIKDDGDHFSARIELEWGLRAR